jgi:hypothetical protein
MSGDHPIAYQDNRDYCPYPIGINLEKDSDYKDGGERNQSEVVEPGNSWDNQET